MKKAAGFITLHRQILDWEWYKNINVKVLFLHLLLKANYKDLSFEGHKILRGQLVTSLPSLSAELGMSTKQIRGSLEHLISTGEVTSQRWPRYRIITIVKYDQYQIDDSLNGSQTADEWTVKRQSNGSQRAVEGQSNGSQRAVSKQYNNSNNVNKGTMEQESEGRTAKRFCPPSRDDIEIFCLENGLTIDIDRFINYYTANGWMVGRNKMKDWQATVRNWATRERGTIPSGTKPAPAKRTVSAGDFEQRDYSDVPEEMISSLAAEIERARKDGII